MNLRSSAQIRREKHTGTHIPYLAHVSEYIVSTRAGDFIQVFRLGGLGFETKDDSEIGLRARADRFEQTDLGPEHAQNRPALEMQRRRRGGRRRFFFRWHSDTR